jgi:hypothetical protein
MNIARLLYIGTTKLGYTETEVFRMTPKKFFLIFDEFEDINGFNKKPGGGGGSISDLP